MTLEDFRQMVAAHGAAPRRWPEELRAPAEALLAASDEARRILAPEARLDALLDAWKPSAVTSNGQRDSRSVEIEAPDLAYLAARANLDAGMRTGAAPHRWARTGSLTALVCAVGIGLAVGAIDLADQLDGSAVFDSIVTAMIFGEEGNS